MFLCFVLVPCFQHLCSLTFLFWLYPISAGDRIHARISVTTLGLIISSGVFTVFPLSSRLAYSPVYLTSQKGCKLSKSKTAALSSQTLTSFLFLVNGLATWTSLFVLHCTLHMHILPRECRASHQWHLLNSMPTALFPTLTILAYQTAFIFYQVFCISLLRHLSISTLTCLNSLSTQQSDCPLQDTNKIMPPPSSQNH